MAITQIQLTKDLNQLLNIKNYQDYGPNGLQIEGKPNIQKIAFAVSATRDSIEQAIALKADAMIVHHGLFWKFHGVRTITDSFAKRVKPLIQNDINLYGYHLPLDAHLEYGNAASLAKKCQMNIIGAFGDYKGMPTGVKAKLEKPMSVCEFQNHLAQVLNHDVLVSTPDSSAFIESFGIITGGANSDWVYCLNEELDAYVTGEMSEHDWNEAKESDIHFFAGGHHATERFGVQSLLQYIHQNYKQQVECYFIDSNNPA